MPSRDRPVLDLIADLAAVVLAWLCAVLVENIVLGVAWGAQFSAAWEVTQVRRVVVPLAVVGLAPASLVAVGWWRVARLASRGARLARAAMAGLGAVFGAWLALGVSQGRHFSSLAVRAPFVLALAAASLAVSLWVVPWTVRVVQRTTGAMLALGLTVGIGSWLVDAFVLPRLYPTFHTALFVTTLAGWSVVGLGLRTTRDMPRIAWTVIAAVTGLLLALGIAWSPRAAARLARLSNLRVVVIEHAPLLGRAVELTMRLRAPTEAPDSGASAGPGAIARSLDWSGHDIVLVTVDALRADHVSAYGYARPTTPNLDALAAEGTLFEGAYCPTPHTSYSVTSLMTGKYMRPLLALGLGEDSETWAQDLRLYGFRTAAFYPPAVFFIDEDRFPRFEREALGFEYAKVEFADPELRERQVADYLAGAPSDPSLFLWVHFFEPHEPYVPHPEHPFSGGASADVDAYDSEVAMADDGIGRIVRQVRSKRPGAAFIVTADHGEEFGEHGGRYHGTTVYEEQVHVPLVVVGPGVNKGARVASVVQTIDLLPTALSALGLPRPARLRGRDLGPLLSDRAKAAADPGFAFAETDDYDLAASGSDRLVCERRAAACSLYRIQDDPGERHDVSVAQPARFSELRASLRAVEKSHGRFEAAGGPVWPEALRRGMIGDVEAAADVASLLDDADVGIRRKAAQVCFDLALHTSDIVPELRRALERDEDDEVRRWSALALVRAGEPPTPLAESLLRDPSLDWRRHAALALGGRGSPRACDVLDAWWDDVAPAAGWRGREGEVPQLAIDLSHAEELLTSTARGRCRGAVPALVRSLQDVRARPFVADALGAIGDERARGPLLASLGGEPYVTARPHEAEALLSLEPQAGTLATRPDGSLRSRIKAPTGPARIIVLLSDATATLEASSDGKALPPAAVDGPVRSMPLAPEHGPYVRVDLRVQAGSIRGVWVAPSPAALD